MPAMVRNISPAKCAAEPTPAEPNDSLRVLASVTNSETDFAGTEGCTVAVNGMRITSDTG